MNKFQKRIEENAIEIVNMFIKKYGENNVICYHGKIWYRKTNEDNWDGMDLNVGRARTRKSIETYIEVRESFRERKEEAIKEMKEYYEKRS